ncbi:MAG TPA: YncE family protein [Gaiellaceae bacterium]|nr:YncE family protein [Gaiellaceae bacterium]
MTETRRKPQEQRRREIRRRRLVAAGTVLALVAAVAWAGFGRGGTGDVETSQAAVKRVSKPAVVTTPAKPRAETKARPSDKARLKLRTVISGNISPKSVVSSGAGYVTAQNMMYRHSVTVYDAESTKLVKTIPDAVNLRRLGYPKYRGTVRGAPVEAAFSPDGRYAYVSNYSMYGAGFGPEGDDNCTPSSGYDSSFVYRIDMQSLKIDRAYEVGAVPKVVAVTPDHRYVLVSNWCTWDLSVISTKRRREVKRISIGAYPRGIAMSPKGNAAYVAVMGGNELIRVDLRRWTTSRYPVGAGPRAAEFHPSDRYIFVSLNAEGRVAKLDLKTGAVRAKVATGNAPRSLALAGDGRALYVVNYESGTVMKLRTSDMKQLQTIEACYHPIGITYDRPTRRVWVACYTGTIRVYDDR